MCVCVSIVASVPTPLPGQTDLADDVYEHRHTAVRAATCPGLSVQREADRAMLGFCFLPVMSTLGRGRAEQVSRQPSMVMLGYL